MSLDGYPQIQNLRPLKSGGSSHEAIIKGLNKLSLLPQSKFKGILCVMDLRANPQEVYDHFLSLGIRRMDFLFPLRNHANNQGYADGMTHYYEWLAPIVTRYFEDDSDSIEIRLIDSIVELLIGSDSPMCAIEGSAIDMLTVDTDGSIQLIDDLRAISDGYVDLGLNIKTHKLSAFFDTDKVKDLYSAETHLPPRCMTCKWLRVCGSGGHAFRWTGNNYSRPSIYCRDICNLIKLVASHIYE
jgi:uncharacterized protein